MCLMSFMDNLLLFKKKSNQPRLSLKYFFALFIFIFLTQCSTQKNEPIPSSKYSISQEERIWLMEFFRDLLFEHDSAYTLYGTKPVSISFVEEPPSEEERTEWKSYFESLSEEEKIKIMTRRARYDYQANYEKWQKIKDRFQINQYLFGSFPLNDRVESILFVNIEMTIRTLLEYYEDFRRVLGFDFDPFQVVFEVEDRSSLFWNKVTNRGHALLGILLGYGRDNAWFFEWEVKYKNAQDKMGGFIRTLPSTVYESRSIKYPVPKHFMLPFFGSYGLYPNDRQLFDKYKKEHAQIEELYKGRDEVDVALEWLTR